MSPAEERHRDLLPLAPLSSTNGKSSASVCRSVNRRILRRHHRTSWANEGIATLNELRGSSHHPVPATHTAAQAVCAARIEEAYSSMGKPPEDTGALQALCETPTTYAATDVHSSTVRPYNKDIVSWPPHGFNPISVGSNLRAADKIWFSDWQRHLLRSNEAAIAIQEEIGLKHAYSDPALKSPLKYAEFLRELQSRGLLRWRRARPGEKPLLGVFFVEKKGNRLRLIFDTRIANTYFKSPASTKLPTAAAFSQIEIPAGSRLHLQHADIENAFYGLEVPAALSEYFTLRSIRADLVGYPTLSDGSIPIAGELLVPSLAVLPMGWSWSLALCQSVLESAIEDAGYSRGDFVQDQKGACVLSEHHASVAAYVDNFGVMSCNRDLSADGVNKIRDVLRRKGLRVHQIECSEPEAEPEDLDFLGLSFDEHSGHVRVKRSRVWRLRFAIDQLLTRNQISGSLLEIVIGHCTWIALLRRESLSVFSSVYAFINKHRHHSALMWSTVHKELRQFRDILPLLYSDLTASWCPSITASDSSPYGVGVCSRVLDPELVGSIGRTCERWRYHFEDAVAARKHAGIEVPVARPCFHDVAVEPDREPSPICDHELSSHSMFELAAGVDREFNEVPDHVLLFDKWTTVHSKPWQKQENILRTEGRALVWSFKHQLRSQANLNQRILALVDNLPLALGAAKGRANSPHLLPTLRQICALSLVSGSRLYVRWIPSEKNVADAPSRRFKGIQAPPNAPLRAPPGLLRHNLHAASQASPPAFASSRGSAQKGCRPRTEEPSIDQHPRARPELPGIKRPQAEHSHGLQCHDPGLRAVGLPGVSELGFGGVLAGDPADVLRLPVLRRSSTTGFPSDGSPAVLHPQSPPSASPSSGNGGLEQAGATTATTPTTKGGTTSNHCLGPARLEHRASSGPLHLVYLLPSPGRMSKTPSAEPHQGQPGCRSWSPDVGVTTPRKCSGSRWPGSFQNGALGRGHSSGPRLLATALSGGDASTPGAARTVQTARERREAVLLEVLPPPAAGPVRAVPISASARRRLGRCNHRKEESTGNQTARALAVRRLSATLCSHHQLAPRGEPHAAAGDLPRKVARAEPRSCFPLPDPDPTAPHPHRRQRLSHRQYIRHANATPSNKPKAQQLREIFRKALRKARCRRHLLFLELFAGHAGVSAQLRSQGFAVVDFELDHGTVFDLTDPTVRNIIKGWLSSGCVLGVWFGTPCTSWSRARRGPIDSGWGPLRSNNHILGLPNLKPNDQEKVNVGNNTASCTADLIVHGLKHNVPMVLENPATSMLWLCPSLQRCLRTHCTTFNLDFCQFGARWRKRTKLACWNIPDATSLLQSCSGHGGVCSRTNKHHIVLTGSDKATGKLWTKIAQPYPSAFCRQAAKVLIAAAEGQRHRRIHNILHNCS